MPVARNRRFWKTGRNGQIRFEPASSNRVKTVYSVHALVGRELAVGTSEYWLQKREEPRSSITLNSHRAAE